MQLEELAPDAVCTNDELYCRNRQLPADAFRGIVCSTVGLRRSTDGHHKSHKKPVALGGGLAVFLAAVVTFAVEYFSSQNLQESLQDNAPFLSGLLLAGGWIVILGLIDDRYGMKG